jgi:hypothetical protein
MGQTLMALSIRQLAAQIISEIEAISLPTTDTPEGMADDNDVFRGFFGFGQLDVADRVFKLIPGLAVRNLQVLNMDEMRIPMAIEVTYIMTPFVFERITNDFILIADTLHDIPAGDADILDVRPNVGSIQEGEEDNTLRAEMTFDVIWQWTGA